MYHISSCIQSLCSSVLWLMSALGRALIGLILLCLGGEDLDCRSNFLVAMLKTVSFHGVIYAVMLPLSHNICCYVR